MRKVIEIYTDSDLKKYGYTDLDDLLTSAEEIIEGKDLIKATVLLDAGGIQIFFIYNQ